MRAYKETIDRMVRVVRENITGIRVIKSLSKTEHERSVLLTLIRSC